MTYFSAFLAPVPRDKKAEYTAHVQAAWPMFRKYGALRSVECWGDDLPPGEVTSFPLAVRLKDGETAALGWIEWPDKATADACWASMESDPEWRQIGDMPFDGKRMIFGGFGLLMALEK